MRVIRRFVRDVAEKFHPEKIILFDSYAYGTPHDDSDVDILVVMPARNEIDQAVKIRLAIPAPFPMDLIVRTPKDLLWRLEEGDWFLREVVSKGTARGDAFLDTLPAVTTLDGVTGYAPLAPGSLVGPYRLIRELGRGGMSLVWLAERVDGLLKRKVALKLPIVLLDNDTLVEVLAGLGLDPALAEAADSTEYDEALRASHDAGMAPVGLDVGTPVIHAPGPDGATIAFFGPVVTPAPKGEAAGRLWDGVLLVAGTPGFYEIKRTRDVRPSFE